MQTMEHSAAKNVNNSHQMQQQTWILKQYRMKAVNVEQNREQNTV